MKGTKFEDIDNAEMLVSYLKKKKRLNGVTCLSTYMNKSSVEELFSSKCMFINNPRRMNDLYEIASFNDTGVDWGKICFRSFMAQKTESIAMWSMYGQPWQEGVMLSIPVSVLQELVNNSPCLISAVYDNARNRYYPDYNEIVNGAEISLSRVAYVDDSYVTCSDKKNKNLKHLYGNYELAGYIKDVAWEYEREIRLRVDLPKDYREDVIFLKLSESFLKEIAITTGPRFDGDMIKSLPTKYKSYVEISPSKFKEKLAWIPCDGCKNS